MRITTEAGKKYRAYSPEEFFKSPESSQTYFNLDKSKPKTRNAKGVHDEKSQKSN